MGSFFLVWSWVEILGSYADWSFLWKLARKGDSQAPKSQSFQGWLRVSALVLICFGCRGKKSLVQGTSCCLTSRFLLRQSYLIEVCHYSFAGAHRCRKLLRNLQALFRILLLSWGKCLMGLSGRGLGWGLQSWTQWEDLQSTIQFSWRILGSSKTQLFPLKLVMHLKLSSLESEDARLSTGLSGCHFVRSSQPMIPLNVPSLYSEPTTATQPYK